MTSPDIVPFSTRLHSLPHVDISIPETNETRANKIKKLARQSLALTHSSDTLGFLHSVMVQIHNKTYLLAGPSGIGKSTYAGLSAEQTGAKVLANDWVGIERDQNRFYVSDVNYPEALKQKKRCALSGVLFLTRRDVYNRDAFVPNDREYLQLLAETFDTATPDELQKLTKFWRTNKDQLPFYCAIPARKHNEAYTEETILQILNKRDHKKSSAVGVVGVGNLGSQIAYQMGQLPSVHTVHLYSRSYDKTQAYAADMNQADTTNATLFVAHNTPKDVFTQSDSVFLSFRDETGEPRPELPERWRKLPAHASIIDDYVQLVSDTQFNGTIFTLTNPVDILTYRLYAQSQNHPHSLRTYQTYGVGLEVDAARALYYANLDGKELSPSQLHVYGNHADRLGIDGPFTKQEQEMLIKKVKSASSDIRKYVPRTVFGPTGAAIRTYNGFIHDGSARVTLMQDDAYIGRQIQYKYGLPIFPEESQREQYDDIIEENKKTIARLDELL